MPIEAARDAGAFRDFEREGWRRAAAAYETSWARVTAQTAGPLLDAAGAARGAAVLDACCGPGVVSEAALARGAAPSGIDLADRFVAIARRRCPGGRFETGDVEALPFPDASFDAAVSGYGIIHVPRPAAALAEMTRVLRPGGRLAASVWTQPEPGTGLGIAFAAIREHADMSVPLPHGPDFFQFSDPPALTAALAGAGLEDVTVRRVEQTLRAAGPGALFRMVTDAAVRMSGLLRAQSPDRLAAVRRAIAAGWCALPNPTAVPMPALIASGRKPR